MTAPTDLLAINTIASANSIDPSSTVGVMSTILGGVAGRKITFNDLSGSVPVPANSLVVVDGSGATADVLDRLVQPAAEIHRQLTERFAKLDPKILSETIAGRVVRDRKGERPTSEAQDYFREHTEAFYGPRDASYQKLHGGAYDFDWTPDPEVPRLDALLRPGFLVQGAGAKAVKDEIARCNASTALVMGGRALRVADILEGRGRELRELLLGTRLPVPALLQGCGGGRTEETRTTWMLEATPSDCAASGFQSLLGNAVLFQAVAAEATTTPGMDLVRQVSQWWGELLREIIDVRRRGVPIALGPRTDTACAAFARSFQDYRRSCAGAGISSEGVRKLPMGIHHLVTSALIEEKRLRATRRGPVTFDEDDEAFLVAETFRHAEILRDRHVAIGRAAAGESEEARLIDLATRIHERVRSRGTISFRDLLRSFSNQKADTYRPVIERMLAEGLVVEDGERIYRPGPERDVAGAIRRSLARERFRAVA